MPPEQSEIDDRLMELVELALAQPGSERQAYLRNSCAGDPALYELAHRYVQDEEDMGDFLQTPFLPPLVIDNPFQVGEVVNGRFRIVREIARGGMGVVYQASDEVLGVAVALKCAKSGFKKRLWPEVLYAQRIGHPNVCKVFDLHTARTAQGDVDFLSMEYLEGETLTERLRRGTIPEPEARDIARQLCAGLAEAHRHSVIHGDLKSNNAILTAAPGGGVRAVITDFGLSRGVEAAQGTKQSGELAGAPDYMAPELWKGAKTSVASDIYALGVMLYEMVSGRRPETGLGEPSWLMMHWHKRTATRLPAVHPKWDPILRRCLAAEPGDRFAQVADVANAMEPSPWVGYGLAAVAAVVLVVVASVGTYRQVAPPKEVIRLTVDAAGPGAGDLLTGIGAKLASIKSNRKTQFEAIHPAPRAMTSPQATHSMVAELKQEGEKIIVESDITDLSTGRKIAKWRSDYPPEQRNRIPLALAGFLTMTFHLPPLATEKIANPNAVELYRQGVELTRRDKGLDQAIGLFARALAISPEEALIHAGMAEAHWFKYYRTRDQRWLDGATESVRNAERLNPDLAPVHLAAGLLDNRAGRYDLALKRLLRAKDLDPENDMVFRRLGLVHRATGSLDNALEAYRRAVALRPDYYRNQQALGSFYFARAQYQESIRYFNKALELEPDEPDVHYSLGSSYKNLGRAAEAEAQLREGIRLQPTPFAMHQLGILLLEQRREREAIPVLRQALQLGGEKYYVLLDLAVAYRRTQARSESLRAAGQGLRLAEHEVTQNPRDGRLHALLGYLCAELGELNRSVYEVNQALALSPDNNDARMWAIRTYEFLGRRAEALALLKESPSGVRDEVSWWPDAAGLVADPRFRSLGKPVEISRN